MNSIDNLRDYVLTAPSVCSTTRAILVGYIDGIEQEVADMRGFCERLDDAATKREDVTLWGVDYTALPIDADGVPIHVGDVMEERSGNTFEVASIMVFGGSDNQLVFSDARNFSSFREPHDIRHNHAPTVEDVLREFYVLAVRGKEAHAEDVDADVLTEYAAKLRLAGDE